jgi:thiol-disulfide isomerase/thioredoxin
MRDLFGVYLKQDAAKALELAEQMVKTNPDDKEWVTTLHLQQLILQKVSGSLPATTIEALKQAATQIALLHDKVDPYEHGAKRTYKLWCKQVAASQEEPLKSALYNLGARLFPKKSREEVDNDVWLEQTKDAKEFNSFELPAWDGRKVVNLAELRGKVVLISYWWPGCTGCVMEFPYFEKLAAKYPADKFVVLAVNVSYAGEKDQMVMAPIWKRHSRITFLKAPDNQWLEKIYGERALDGPTNYMLDTAGRVAYGPPFDVLGREELELTEKRIDWLLSRASAAKAN